MTRNLLTWLFVVFVVHVERGSNAGDQTETAIPGISSELSLINSSAIAKELSLTNEQLEQLKLLDQHRKDIMREFIAELDSTTPEQRAEGAVARRRERLVGQMLELDRKIDKVLLPHQSDRFRQLVVQSQTRKFASSFGLLNPTLSRKLKLTSEQEAAIRESVESHEMRYKARLQEMRAELDMMRTNAFADVNRHLTLEQRREYDAFYGAPFPLDRAPVLR